MVEDIWTCHNEALKEIIQESLEKRDFQTLRGIQCFSEATRWAHLVGMETIINVLFYKSMEMKKEAEKLDKRIEKNKEHYETLGTDDSMRRRLSKLKKMKIPFIEVKNACRELTRSVFLDNLSYLEGNGFIITDRKGDWESSTIWLPERLWNGLIEDAHVNGQESSVYSSALGTMIAHCTQDRPVSTLIALVNALNQYSKGEISHEALKNEYFSKGISEKVMINFLEHDSAKAEGIKAIIFDDGQLLRFSREILLANEMVRQRALSLALKRKLSR